MQWHCIKIYYALQECIINFVLKVVKERWRPTFFFSFFSELFSKKSSMHLQHVTLQIPACKYGNCL